MYMRHQVSGLSEVFTLTGAAQIGRRANLVTGASVHHSPRGETGRTRQGGTSAARTTEHDTVSAAQCPERRERGRQLPERDATSTAGPAGTRRGERTAGGRQPTA